MISSLASSRWFRLFAVVAIIFLGVLIGLPFLIQQQARIWLEDNGGERVVIRDVDFNPFTGELVLKNLLIEVEDRQPLHFDSARLELEWLPLVKKRIDVQAVELQGFYLLINNEDILRIGGILLPAAGSEAEETSAETSPWLAGIHTLTLKDFTLVYHDAALDQKVYIDSLELSTLKQWDPEIPAVLEYRGAVNEAAVQLDAKMAPFAQTPTFKGTISIDKLSLTDFEPLAKPALETLDGLLSVDGSFEIEQANGDIRVRKAGELALEGIDIAQEQMALQNRSLGWDGNIDFIFNSASSQSQLKAQGELTVEDTDVQHELLKLTNQMLAWDGVTDVTLDSVAGRTHVNSEGELKIEDSNIEHELLKLANEKLAWKGATNVTLDAGAEQTQVKTQGKLTLEDIDARHALAHLSNRSLIWDGATDLDLSVAASRSSVKNEGKLTSNDLSTRLQQQKLKLEYQNLDMDVVFSYTDSEAGSEVALNSQLLVSGLDLFAPDKNVDIISARKLQLAGLEIKGPEHVLVKEIAANGLDLGRSLEQQATAVEEEKRAMFHVEKLLISGFSHVDGFTAVDTITEDDVHAIYHRDKEGKWNVVTLLEALAAEDSDAVETEDSATARETPAGADAKSGEPPAKKSVADDDTQDAAGPPPIAVRRADVSEGSSLTIIDESVTPAFKTTMTVNELFLENLDGRDPQKTATFKLDGRFDEHAGIKASGDIKPYLHPPEMDIEGKLEAIVLPPLSPYTTDSIGVMIDSGSLDADLKLVSQDQLMKGEAVLLMHQLSVKGTDSKDGLQSAIPVPLDMALNILRDKNDAIELKIPIEGDANNPDFDVSDAITKAVAKGVSAGATSYLVYALQPYGAMVAVAKVAGEQAAKIRLDPVEFEPGQATLDDNDHEYLGKIAKVLKERPKIAVKVCGVAVQQDVAKIQPPPAKTTEKTASKQTAEGRTAPPPAPPVVDEQKLTELGEQRAAAIRDYLVNNFKISASRLTGCQTRLETDQADAKPRTDLLL